MKVRTGFVSNSSSSSFVMDLRNPITREFIRRCRIARIHPPDGLNRRTAIAVGEDAVNYAKEWQCETFDWYADDKERTIAVMILDWAKKLGSENVVFARDSDEGMGGYLPAMPDDEKCILEEMEYH